MLSSSAREVEHRRGLVLGLTLAEVLLLLLFLLLLALGAQLAQLREKLEATPDQDKAERHRLEAQLAEFRAILSEAEKINPDDPPAVLRRALELSRMIGPEVDPSRLRVVTTEMARFLEEASKLDTQAPPELLGLHGIEIIKKTGYQTPIEQIERIRPEMVKVIAAAKEIDPQRPEAVLARAISNLKRSAEPALSSDRGMDRERRRPKALPGLVIAQHL